MNHQIVRLPALPAASVQGLLALKQELGSFEATGYSRRVGANKKENMSCYSTNKIEMNPMAIRRRFREFLPEKETSRALTEYFLDLPPETGLLDRQVYWLDVYTSMRMFSYALQDQSIWIDEKVGAVHLNQNNVEQYFGHTVWLEGENDILSAENVDKWIQRLVNVRTPMAEYKLEAGDGIMFVINHVHELKVSPKGQQWACIGAAPY